MTRLAEGQAVFYLVVEGITWVVDQMVLGHIIGLEKIEEKGEGFMMESLRLIPIPSEAPPGTTASLSLLFFAGNPVDMFNDPDGVLAIDTYKKLIAQLQPYAICGYYVGQTAVGNVLEVFNPGPFKYLVTNVVGLCAVNDRQAHTSGFILEIRGQYTQLGAVEKGRVLMRRQHKPREFPTLGGNAIALDFHIQEQ